MKQKSQSKDTSPLVFQRDKIDRELQIRERPDLTAKQKLIIEAALDKKSKCILIDGKSGSGKSFISILCALKLLNEKKVSQIVYIRSLVQAKDGETGFLSGNLEEKTYYYNLPLFSLLEEILPKADAEYLMKDNRIITLPTSMLRSYNFHNSAIILEESQNICRTSLETGLTRAGMYSKVFCIGDSVNQNDLGKTSGFAEFASIFSDQESKDNGFRYFELTSDDIVRSPFVKFVVQKLEKYNKENSTNKSKKDAPKKSHCQCFNGKEENWEPARN